MLQGPEIQDKAEDRLLDIYKDYLMACPGVD